MSRNKKIILLLAFPVIGFLSILISGTDDESSSKLSTSTFSAAPVGTKALFLLLEELNFPVKRFAKSFNYLASTNAVLVVTDPKAVKITPLELDNLDKWIRRGNRLLLMASVSPVGYRGSNNAFQSGLGNSWKLADHFRLKIKTGKASPDKVTAAKPPGFSGTLKVVAEGRSRWDNPGAEWKILAEDRAGPILLWKKFGQGGVFALSDPGMFANGQISREGNVKLALAVLSGSDEIIFDEYHHGSGTADSFWTFVGNSVFALIWLQTVVTLSCLFYSRRAAVAGKYRPLSIGKGRSSLEYVDSMANVTASCRAGSTALEAILHRFLGKLSRRRGLSLNLKSAAADPSEINIPGADEELINLLEQCADAVKKGAEEEHSLELAKKLNSFRRMPV